MGVAMPFPLNLGPKRLAVVDPASEPSSTSSSDVATQTAIGFIAPPRLFIHDVLDAPK